MFDNTKPNVIILADITDANELMKGIGPHKVANRLRKNGYQVAVIQHLHVFSYEEIEHILTQMISDKTLFVGVNNMFYKDMSKPIMSMDGNRAVNYDLASYDMILPHNKEYNFSIINAVKRVNPKCKWVIGGPKAEDLEGNRHFDYIVTGYADNSIVNLSNHLLNGEPLKHSYKSVYGPIVITDSLAKDYDFIADKMEFCEDDCILPGETLAIEISRGCIFRCKFCAFPLNGKKKNDHIKYENILREEFIENWKKYNVTRYFFSDDTFNDSPDKIEMIYRISKSLPFKLEFWAYIRLDLLTAKPYTIDLLIESGLISMFCGIETLNEKTASIIGKGGNRERQLETLRYIQTKWPNQVSIHASFILGLPQEDIHSMTETIETAFSSDCPFDSFRFFPLGIRDSKTNNFNSDFDLNYKDYGYRFKAYTGASNKGIDWVSDLTSFEEMKNLRDRINKRFNQHDRHILSGQASIIMMGYGMKMEEIHKKVMKDIDWGKVLNLREARIQEYKQLVYSTFNIPKFESDHK